MAPTADVLEQLFVNRYLALISFTILYYDYLLTLADEIERYWGHRLTWPAFFYFLNRYVALFGHILVALQTFYRTTLAVCKSLHTFHQLYAVVSQLNVGALLIIRTYALYGRARWVMWLLCGITFVAFVLSMWAIFAHKSASISTDTGGYCDSGLTAEQARWLLVPWAEMLVFDTVVFVLTVRQSLLAKRASPKHSLFNILLRDGAIYFVAFAGSNFANIYTFAYGKVLTRGVFTTFCNVISETLISRLMLNVRDPAFTSRRQFTSTSRTLRTRSWPPFEDTDTHGPGLVSTMVRFDSPPDKESQDFASVPQHPDATRPQESSNPEPGSQGDIELVDRRK